MNGEATQKTGLRFAGMYWLCVYSTAAIILMFATDAVFCAVFLNISLWSKNCL